MDVRKVSVRAVRSDGSQFEYQNADWGVKSLEGIGFSPVEIFKSARGSGHGDIITGKRKGSRDIDIVATSRNKSQNHKDRALALGFHNANYTFDLYITYMGVTRIAKNCELQGAKCPAKNVYKKQELTVSFLMPDADLLGTETERTTFEEVYPLWHTTRVYTEGGSLPFGIIERATTKEIQYLGSEPAPFTVTVKATGYVENINVALGDVSCHVTCELSDSDVLQIDTGERIVTLNGEKLADELYDATALSKMLLGYDINKVTVVADDAGNTAFDSEVKYTGRYGGV